MRFSVDPWDVEYGVSLEIDQPDSSAEVVVDLEAPADEWDSIDAGVDASQLGQISFIDGVRRIDARVWIEDEAGDVQPGVCASFAAGGVRCDGRATISAVEVARGIFSTAP